ncbi:YjbH domain-containing protein [Lentibacter algarum]|uniref:YjbH domain-containing protein n=1 Tax=Lentibacter algarum TaxID=576131 RepID=UPI001C06D1FC|nr:YjbH domain-containing protein [Lentibacter algarum]MBU2981217.1 YjbH domain-containing protein [Lentibacter algarum]
MRKSLTYTFATLGLLAPSVATPEGLTTTNINMWGLPGSLIDMPTAEAAPDAQLSTTVSHFGGTTKTSMTFQLTPRISGTFRYSAIRGLNVTGYTLPAYYDRSFDLRYRLLDETRYRPAVSIGLRDLLGTGLHGGEYIVATKSVGDKLRFTGGLGWGRLGSYGSFATMGSRPTGLLGGGGIPNYDRWFRGPVAAFGGVSYQHNDKLSFAVEYSSDAYAREEGDGLLEHKSPFNFGVKYQFSNAIQLGASYMHGNEVGVYAALSLNPKHSPVNGGTDIAPEPVARRTAAATRDLGWTTDPTAKPQVEQSVSKALAREGIVLEAMRIDAKSAEILIRNERYDIESQAVGRSMRSLSRVLPSSIETLTVTHSSKGMPAGSVTLNRSDIEALEHAPAADILARARFSADSDIRALETVNGAYPRLSWHFGPSIKLSVFDPDSPVRADVMLNLEGDYHIAPGWVASAAINYKLGGNLDGLSPNRTGVQPVNPPHAVRSDARLYAEGNGPKIDHLTIAKFGRHGENLYSRVTFGYLEQMYAGVSGELLWKPAQSRLAIGVEANYVAQRDFNQRFGLQDYKVATGHVSAYYDLGRGFHTQLDVGRYLAGDFGATVSVDREFGNGWRVGAYATKTTLSSASFGEGSFDKGIRLTMPMSWALGNSTKRSTQTTIQSLTRDGGARLHVGGRLYDNVRTTHGADMAKTWGRFWR